MALQAKHIVEEINEVRCTIVEKGASAERVEFLKGLLEFNKLQVMVAEEARESEEVPQTFTIGVTDLVFHPTIAVYEMTLKTPDGRIVSPAYWEQKSQESIEQYWLDEEDMKSSAGAAWFYTK